jgi:hypothetical protein
MAQDFTLDLSDAYARQGASSPDLGDLDNIMTPEGQEHFFELF